MLTPRFLDRQNETYIPAVAAPPFITPAGIVYSRNNGRVKVYAKMENFQRTDSVKYRAAWHLVNAAEGHGHLNPGRKIIEESSGNTGIALACIGMRRGYPVTIVVSKDGCTYEAQRIMASYGADVIPVDGWMPERQALIRDMMNGDSTFYWTRQGQNPATLQSSESMGIEILGQVPCVDLFLACTGTCATISGVGSALKTRYEDTRVMGVIPATEFDLQGVDDYRTYCTPLLKEEILEEPFVIEDRRFVMDATRELQSKGHLVGFSAGASYYAAVKQADRMEKGNILIIFPDKWNRYYSTWRRLS